MVLVPMLVGQRHHHQKGKERKFPLISRATKHSVIFAPGSVPQQLVFTVFSRFDQQSHRQEVRRVAGIRLSV